MSRSLGKFIAILMLLWLPLFSGSALAAAIAMQMPNGSCHEAAMQMEAIDMDMGDHDRHISITDEHGNSCSALCHLACTGYLAVPDLALISAHTTERQITPYLVSFRSITSAPLVPPPLAPV